MQTETELENLARKTLCTCGREAKRCSCARTYVCEHIRVRDHVSIHSRTQLVITPSRSRCERHFTLFFTCVCVCMCTQGHSRSPCAFCRPCRHRLRRERRASSLPNPTVCLSVGTPRSEALP